MSVSTAPGQTPSGEGGPQGEQQSSMSRHLPSTAKQHLALLEHDLESLKAELAYGTPIDPEIISELERRIKKLKE